MMFQIILKAYSLIYAVLGTIYAIFNLVSPENRSVVGGRLRFPGPEFFVTKPDELPRIWIHAVSVGEVNAVKPLAERFIRAGYELFFSTTTRTGQELAKNIFCNRARVFYFPIDLKKSCKRILRSMNPAAVLLVETEIWPNFIVSVKDLSIPLILINGRISDKSFRNYQRFGFFFRPLWKSFSGFCMQSKIDKQRILTLGAENSQVNWVGNLKYDVEINTLPDMKEIIQKIISLLKNPEDSLLWLCGSTKPGEEELLLEVYSKLLNHFDSLNLLIAPRHPDRAEEIGKLLEERGFRYLKRSSIETPNQPQRPERILILDSMGELAHLYHLADVVFIGGSLVPEGGQNPLEPASVSCPILFGPHMENFREISEQLVSRYAALQVNSAAELGQRLHDLLKDKAARDWLGRNSRKVIRENRGAVERTFNIVTTLVQKNRLDSGTQE